MPSHFEPMSWTIELEFTSAALVADVTAQATFVHEYIHYVQTLTGTIGRITLVELVRLTIRAGLESVHGQPLAPGFGQIDLAAALARSTRADFAGTEVAAQYRDFSDDLEFALGDGAVRVDAPVDPSDPAQRFVRRSYQRAGRSVSDFIHARVPHNGSWFAVPLTDRVFFENMARQVQRNFLYFNANTTSPIDDLKRTDGEVTYLAVNTLFDEFLPPTESRAKWTVAACQFALLCRHPGTAFERFFTCAAAMREPDLAEVRRRLGRDSWFAGEFDQPPLQANLDELIGKWGTAMRPVENYELHGLTKSIATAYNVVNSSYEYFADPLFTWQDVGGWLARFGCPRILSSDGEVADLHGVRPTVPWGPYLQAARNLLL